MTKGDTKTYQDILKEFSQIPKTDVKVFSKKYVEVLEQFLELNEVYTIASTNSTIEEVENNTARPLCAKNYKKLPCVWFFSEREFAQTFVKHFGLIKDGVEYIKVLDNKNLIETIKESVFNGVYQFAVDESKQAIVVLPYDLWNVYLEKNGQEKFLEFNQYDLMVLFNSMRFFGKTIFAIESDELDENNKNILAADRKGVLNLFVKQEDADVHKYDIGYGRKESTAINLIQLKDSINSIINDIKLVRFEVDEGIIEIKTEKLAYILNEMTKFYK